MNDLVIRLLNLENDPPWLIPGFGLVHELSVSYGIADRVTFLSLFLGQYNGHFRDTQAEQLLAIPGGLQHASLIVTAHSSVSIGVKLSKGVLSGSS